MIIVAIIVTMSTFAQSISPAVTAEFCPNVNITFSVTLPRIADNSTPNVASWTNTPILVSGVSNLVNTSTQTTFTFVGNFRDVNINQVFRVTYVTTTNPNAVQDFQFKRIKSLFYSSVSTAFPPCNVIKPNQTQPVVFPRCQVASTTISFPNIQWFTNFETPELCFGTVTDYEYQLPANWSIGGFPSNGSNWIAGGNSVVITSDLSTGDGADIKIRASNKTCGIGLFANGPVSTVRISRPEPTLIISSNPQNYICNINGTTNLTISGMPTGSTVQWALPSGNTNAQIVGCSTCPTITVQKLNNANTTVVVTATVTHCSYTYTRTFLLTLGKGAESTNFLSLNVTCEYTSRWTTYFYGSCVEIPNAISYDWYTKDLSNASNPYVFKGSTNSIDFPLRLSNRYYEIKLVTTTPCGQLVQGEEIFAPNCTNGGNAKISLSPNPAVNTLTIQTIDDRDLSTDFINNISEIIISDKLGNDLIKKKFTASKVFSLQINSLKPGLYILRAWNGKTWTSEQFLKQ